jgi:hypothetical protein
MLGSFLLMAVAISSQKGSTTPTHVAGDVRTLNAKAPKSCRFGSDRYVKVLTMYQVQQHLREFWVVEIHWLIWQWLVYLSSQENLF